jgi:hypothetical protein
VEPSRFDQAGHDFRGLVLKLEQYNIAARRQTTGP